MAKKKVLKKPVKKTKVSKKKSIDKKSTKSSKTPVLKYDWEKILGKKKGSMEKGKDYKVETKMMVQQFRNAAKRRGFKVSIKTEKGNKRFEYTLSK